MVDDDDMVDNAECDVFVEIVADRLPILVQSEEEQSRLLGRVRR